MNTGKLIAQAKEKAAFDRSRMEAPFYRKTIAWLYYLGLLRHNNIPPRRYVVTLSEALEAGVLEPRVFELLPAILVVLPKAIKFKKDEVPVDLAATVSDIRRRRVTKEFRGVPPDKILHWVQAPAMDIAKRRLNYHRVPRRRQSNTHTIGEVIRNSRINLSLTQAQLAKKYGLSIRVIRDLEQGKMSASLEKTNEILAVFGSSLNAR